jgi:hypothetical protein
MTLLSYSILIKGSIRLQASNRFTFVMMDSDSAMRCSKLLAVNSTKIMLEGTIMIILVGDMIFLKIPLANLLLLERRVTTSQQ